MTAVVPIAADDVLAAGYSQLAGQIDAQPGAVILRWDGGDWSTWEHQPDGEAARFVVAGMAATSDNDVWLWGTDPAARAPSEQVRHWDGRSWSILTNRGLPYDWSGDLLLVGSTPWLVGRDEEHGGAFIASYRPATSSRLARWVAGTYARSGGFNGGVVLPSGEAWAVGSTGDETSSRTAPLIAHRWHGVWRMVATAGVAGALSAVAAAGPHDVLAVGTERRPRSPTMTQLVLRYDGHRWHQIPAPTTARQLTAVAVAPDGYWLSGEDSSDGNHSVYYDLGSKGFWNTVEGPRRDFATSPDFTHINQIARLPGSTAQWAVGFHYTDGCVSDGCIDDDAGALLIDEHS